MNSGILEKQLQRLADTLLPTLSTSQRGCINIEFRD